MLQDQIEFISSFFSRYAQCDNKYCFRHFHTTIYCKDGVGLLTPVLAFCRKHSGTEEEEKEIAR